MSVDQTGSCVLCNNFWLALTAFLVVSFILLCALILYIVLQVTREWDKWERWEKFWGTISIVLSYIDNLSLILKLTLKWPPTALYTMAAITADTGYFDAANPVRFENRPKVMRILFNSLPTRCTGVLVRGQHILYVQDCASNAAPFDLVVHHHY